MRNGHTWAAVGVTAVFVVMALSWWSHTIDDAYITARCARNLAEGHGPRLNVDDPAEVSSSPLSVWSLAGISWLGGDPVLAAKLIGLISGTATVFLLLFIARKLGLGDWNAVLLALVMAVAPGLQIHSVGGLETAVFALAVTYAAWRTIACKRSHFDLPWVLAVSTVSCLRPEGIAVGIGLIAIYASRAGHLRSVVVAVALVGIALVVRYVEHGSLAPNAYYAKPSLLGSAWAALGSGHEAWGQITDAIRTKANHPPIGMGWLVYLATTFSIVHLRRSPAWRPFVFVAAFGLAFTALAPPDWMPRDRFFIPFLPSALLITFKMAADSGLTRPLRRTRGVTAFSVFAAALLVANLVAGRDLATAYRSGTIISALDAGHYHRPIGEWLREHANAEDSVLAYEIGAIGYFSRLKVVDHEGIGSRKVAELIGRAGGYQPLRHGRDPKAADRIVDICLESRPTWYLVRSRLAFQTVVGQPLPSGVARTWIQNRFLERTGAEMVVARRFTMTRPNDCYYLLQRSPTRRPEAAPPR